MTTLLRAGLALRMAVLALLLAPVQAQASTVISADYTSFGTFEMVVQDVLPVGTTGTADIYAPIGPGVMVFDVMTSIAGAITSPVSGGILFEGTSDSRGYSNLVGTLDGLLTAKFAWEAMAWNSAFNWDSLSPTGQQGVLDGFFNQNGTVSSLFATNCNSNCSTGGGGNNSDTPGGQIPLPASALLLLAAIGSLGAAGKHWRRQTA